MKSIIEVAVGIAAAVVLATALGKISLAFTPVFNPFAVAVVYFGLTRGVAAGAGLGCVCGLVQDSTSLGVFGVAGLSKTVLGYLTAFISRKINVMPFTRNVLFLFIVSGLELGLWAALVFFVFTRNVGLGGGLILFQPFLTALLGSLLFLLRRRIRREDT